PGGRLWPQLKGGRIASFQENARAANACRAQGVQKRRQQRVHLLEERRQCRNVLLRRVQTLLPVALLVEHGPGTAVDEDEFRPQDEALALHEDALGDDRPPPELVVDLALLRDDARGLMRTEDDRARHDERLLELLANPLPVIGV